MKVAVWGNGRMANATIKMLNYPYEQKTRSSALPSQCDVIIDFSNATATKEVLEYAIKTLTPLVIGTTGQNSNQLSMIEQSSKSIPIVLDSNFSFGMAVFDRTLKELAKSLANWDCSLIEYHHRTKADKPSGTAKKLNRHLDCEVQSVRCGDLKGKHEVIFGGKGEYLTFTHTAENVDIYAVGAIRSAEFIIGRSPRLYSFYDVIDQEI